MPLAGYLMGTRPIDPPSQSIMPDIAGQQLCLFQSVCDRCTLAATSMRLTFSARQFPTQQYDTATSAGQVGHILRSI